MKRLVTVLLCGLTFTAASLAAEMGTPSAGENVSWAAEGQSVIEKTDDAMTGYRAVVSPDAIISTRSSFTALWNPMSQATSYRLDVSTSPSFDSYVTGYHGLEVGPVTWRGVSGFRPGTAYYY